MRLETITENRILIFLDTHTTNCIWKIHSSQIEPRETLAKYFTFISSVRFHNTWWNLLRHGQIYSSTTCVVCSRLCVKMHWLKTSLNCVGSFDNRTQLPSRSRMFPNPGTIERGTIFWYILPSSRMGRPPRTHKDLLSDLPGTSNRTLFGPVCLSRYLLSANAFRESLSPFYNERENACSMPAPFLPLSPSTQRVFRAGEFDETLTVDELWKAKELYGSV